MAKQLLELRQILLQGQKLSMQGSMDRRMPDKKAVPYLLQARKGLREYVIDNTNDAAAWRLLSQAEECLLNYKGALDYLQKAVELSGKDRNDLKKLILLKEYQEQRTELGLSPEQLNQLGDFLSMKLEECPCDHSLTFTKNWLDDNISPNRKTKVVKAIQNEGGFCDCEVLANVVS